MPSSAPDLSHFAAARLLELGEAIRVHRKQLKISATSTAEAAGMSRVTLHRIEKGAPAVTMGAYVNALTVLGLEFTVRDKNCPAGPAASPLTERTDRQGWIPVRVALASYPQLRRIAWHLGEHEVLTPQEALTLYERNERHLDLAGMPLEERQLLEALRDVFGRPP